MFCQVVLREATRTFDREYTYAVPAALSGSLQPGCLVEVPFGSGNRTQEAFVTAILPHYDSDFHLKPIGRLLSSRPLLLPDQILLAAQMRPRYLCTYGDALRCMVPPTVAAVGDKRVRAAELFNPEDAARRLADGELERVGHVRVIELLLECGQAPVHEIYHACQVTAAVLKTLEKKELIRFFQMEVRRSGELTDIEPDHTAGGSASPDLQKPFAPNADQATAIQRIIEGMNESHDSGRFSEFLLFGITGSGKTEVYLQTAQLALAQQRDVIILVPEISLTPQMIGRIRARFGNQVAVLHSRLTPAERYEQWQRILNQEVRLVVGARSAVFAPLAHIGLIIIDEEQESSYKSETHPRYHTREVARIRCQYHQASLVLGSATPSVESYQRAESGKAILLTLPERIGSAGLPQVQVVDMRQELRENNRSIFSRALQNALSQTLAAGRQAMLFINRRGYSGFVLCRDCGLVLKCQACSVSLTYHLGRQPVVAKIQAKRQMTSTPAGATDHEPQPAEPADFPAAPVIRPPTTAANPAAQLICHYCGRISRLPSTCPRCGSTRIGRFGAGTQQVETLFNQTYPTARAIRMDQDTTSGRQAHATLLQTFSRHEADVLIGTQMIAKGHDFPNVTVVGILAADLMLGLSDFRASERAFQLITQAAGRAGRGDQAGTVIIQAYNTDDFAIQAAAAQDYLGFYRQEIAYRRAMHYPPFGAIGLVLLSGVQDKVVQERLQHLHAVMVSLRLQRPEWQVIDLSEPARAPLQQIRGRYRWRLIVKAPTQIMLAAFFAAATDRFDFKRLAVTMDIDPWSML